MNVANRRELCVSVDMIGIWGAVLLELAYRKAVATGQMKRSRGKIVLRDRVSKIIIIPNEATRRPNARVQ